MSKRCGILAFVLLSLVPVTGALAIINGSVDADHPAVGAVMDGSGMRASAVLIDPWWVLTSASFASVAGPGWFCVGADCAAPDATYDFGVVYPHPGFDPDTAVNDIALIRLAAPVADVAPLPYLTVPVLYGANVCYVGYGMTSIYDETNTLRRFCVNAIDGVYFLQFSTSYNGAGPYLGDMGGPALLVSDGAEKVAGIISTGDASGVGPVLCTKVPAYASWIQGIMEANPPLTGVPGGPVSIRLLGAAPNPFNPATVVSFDLDAPAVCRLAVFDLRGRQVAVLLAGRQEAGRHAVRWNGRSDGGPAMPSGVYLVELRAGDRRQTGKLVLAR